jgi:signal transduction histidine kinase/HPt (histidine-containing phosphotransfer) domain-containing protein
MRCYRLLIIDDDAADRRRLTDFLAPVGAAACQIQQAADGKSGLAALQEGEFDCLLLDCSLPDMTGSEFLSAAGFDAEQSSYAVVMLTGQGSEAIAVESMKRGVQDYVTKDQLDPDALWRAVTNAVAKAELQRRLAGSLRDRTASNLALEQETVTRKAAEAGLRTAQEAAEQAVQAKMRLVAMVTHELRTPLEGILGHIRLLRIGKGLSGLQETQLAEMTQTGQHLLRMIDRVLDFASFEKSRMTLSLAEVPVRELAEECINSVSPMAAERGLKLILARAFDTPRRFVTDPVRLRQVILNLLDNAGKYTETGSVELRLQAGASPGGLRVEVADTGRGIDEADRTRLLHDFERLDDVTSVDGSGLGLAIAAGVVTLMGGTIDYYPNPNGGSVFWFELPAAEFVSPLLPLAEQAETSVNGTSSSIGRPVLLVDDIKINRDIIGAFLNSAGYAVILAEGGVEAVRLATEQDFDVILMDVRMPEMDGFEATRRIRALPGARGQVPILGQTAYTFQYQMAQCREAGMDGQITKPVDYETLVHAVRNAIARIPLTDMEFPQSPGAAAEESPVRFDRAAMDQMLALLPADDIAATLQSLHDREEQMLRLLEPPIDRARQSDAAHSLASAAGMFGFAALSTASRDFELAVAQHASDADGMAEQLRVEIGAALTELEALRNGGRAPYT